MPKHPDAVGYLNDLAKVVNEQWFVMLCDLATVQGVSALDQPNLDTLFALYTGRASYIGFKSTAVVTAATPTVSVDTLEQLTGFANFKRLGDALDVTFKKRITLIFGANGSGKSSLCESLKVLANPGQPSRPLENLRVTGAVVPTFRFKFKSDGSQQTWTPASGYGPKRSTVKYFDTAIAIQNVTSAIEPGRVIVVSPFKLHIFEWAKALTTKFREALQQEQNENAKSLALALQTIRADYARFKTHPLAIIEMKSAASLAVQIKLGEDFKDKTLLEEKRRAVAELEKATSEEGLRLLRAEHRELELLLTTLSVLLGSAEALWALDPANKAKSLTEKQAAQSVLAKELIPEGSTLESLLSLLRAADTMCKMNAEDNHACPLCKRDLGASEIKLFMQYHSLLVGELEKEITAISTDLDKARELIAAVDGIDREAWDKCKTLPEEVLSTVKTNVDLIVASSDIIKEPAAEAKAALESLKASVITWSTQLESKKSTIETAAKGRDEIVEQLLKLRTELEPLEYAQAILDGVEKLREAHRMVTDAQYWSEKLPAFTQLLRQITDTAKVAYENLVATDFESRLDEEYRALAEKDMAAFGVKLARKGADAAVTMLPQIGGKGIDGVLSEGEQRLHALALFFAELETCSQSVLVFDDPISSFDYNYIANYCARLRDFTLKHPTRQIIVLTHNWEFFVQLQTTMNQAALDGHLSVYVLENCTVVADYSEKIEDLKGDIIAVLGAVGEPSRLKKEEIAGKMRRLIEAIVNTHVFNNQRHQYKQKSQQITAFQSFTRITALLPSEAMTLRDLYAKLSITEHDDPRNAYVNTDKAMFQTRYDGIVNVEAALILRKLP